MTDREILTNAIDKAIANGLNPNVKKLAMKNLSKTIDSIYSVVIFNHSFAKAFWGEDKHIHWDEGYYEENSEDYKFSNVE